MPTFKSLVSARLHAILRNSRVPICYLFSSSFSSTSTSNPQLFDFFVKQGFAICQSISLSNRFSYVKSMKKAQSTIQFFRDLGFSDVQVRCAVCVQPQIVFADVEKTLQPRIRFFQDLGFTGSNLARFVSKNSSLLTVSVEKKMGPSVEILKTILTNDKNSEELYKVLQNCGWLLSRDPRLFLLPNIAFLKSCGIVGSQLSYLLRRQPRLFISPESKLKNLVSRSLDMGFFMKSRMLVYALYHLSSISTKTLDKKIKLFISFGFSHGETVNMFRKAPALLCVSEEKLKLGLEFYMGSVGLTKEVLVMAPTCLMYSFEKRVIPRFNVLEVLKLKGLLKKDPSSVEVVMSREDVFVRRFISRFEDDMEELLVAYRGHLLDSSGSSEKVHEEE